MELRGCLQHTVRVTKILTLHFENTSSDSVSKDVNRGLTCQADKKEKLKKMQASDELQKLILNM